MYFSAFTEVFTVMEKYLEAGKIVNSHGVNGYVRIESWCDNPKILASLRRMYIKKRDGEMIEMKVIVASVHKGMGLVKFEGINSIDDALLYKNHVVFADRNDLPLEEGSHFIADLIGLDIIDADNGQVYGKLREVINRGASNIYVIDTADGEEAMMPAVDEFVKKIDPEKGIFVTPIPGIFSEAEKA